MPTNNRPSFRDVDIYNGISGKLIGGLKQNGSITEAVFFYMLNILLVTDAPLEVKHRGSERTISLSSNALERGVYDVFCDRSLEMTKERWYPRIYSYSASSGYDDNFRDGVRTRDGKCVITDIVNLNGEDSYGDGFNTVHIFPLERENVWLEQNLGQHISDMNNVPDLLKMNSCQNGLLLSSSVQTSFDACLISVNPEDGYEIIVYTTDVLGISGKVLDPICRNTDDRHRIYDELLRWHFRQSVLANVKGLGKPIFEHDFPVGSDMMGEIMEEPYAKERLEMEFARRFRMKNRSAASEDSNA